MSTTPRRILDYGLSSGNASLVQLLGLCPLLAVSNSAVKALGLGLATLLALTLTNAAVAGIRHVTRHDVRIPAFVLVIAAVVTSIELGMRAWLPELHAVLGLFLPLMVSNCALLGRAEACASRSSPGLAALDGFAVGLGFFWVLLLIGGLRELVGAGTLFAGAGPLLYAPWLEQVVFDAYPGFLLALLPVGAFWALAGLIALRQTRLARKAMESSP